MRFEPNRPASRSESNTLRFPRGSHQQPCVSCCVIDHEAKAKICLKEFQTTTDSITHEASFKEHKEEASRLLLLQTESEGRWLEKEEVQNIGVL